MNMKPIQIGKFIIGQNHPCFLIAEAGVNHNGDVDIAKKLIDAAVESGANAVKFQTFVVDEGTPKDLKKVNYQKQGDAYEETMYKMLKDLEFGFSEFSILKDYCDNKGIIFLSTASDFKSLEIINELDVIAYKVGSADITNIPLIRKIASKNRPIILSTGMSEMDEITEAIDSITNEGNEKIILLQCTSNYPTNYTNVNLKVLVSFQHQFNFPIGFSDHTIGDEISIAAVTLGANIIEKHLTLDNEMEGPDHAASMEPEDFARMVKSIRNVEAAFGTEEKQVLSSEKQVRTLMRRSILAYQNLAPGTILTENNIKIMKSSGGLHPRYLDTLIGKKIIRKKKRFDFISLEDVE